jgi:hypothetical protein
VSFIGFEYGYEGMFKDDKPNGKGKLINKDLDVYEGDFVNSRPSGKGKKVYHPSGNVYEGDFLNA